MARKQLFHPLRAMAQMMTTFSWCSRLFDVGRTRLESGIGQFVCGKISMAGNASGSQYARFFECGFHKNKA
jgi:hypothetical protein